MAHVNAPPTRHFAHQRRLEHEFSQPAASRCTSTQPNYTITFAVNASSTNFPAMMSSKTGQNAPRLQQAFLHYCKDTHEEHHPTHKKKASCKYTSVNTSASPFSLSFNKCTQSFKMHIHAHLRDAHPRTASRCASTQLRDAHPRRASRCTSTQHAHAHAHPRSALSTSMSSTSTRRSPSAMTSNLKQDKRVVEYSTCMAENNQY